MKRTLLSILAIFALSVVSAVAQNATGTLAVTATVSGSIGLSLTQATGGASLGGTPTAATLALGTISAANPGTAGGVTVATGATSLTVSTPVNVTVTSYNYKSSNYTLSAKLSNADTKDTWSVAGTAITNTVATNITAAGPYGTAVADTLAIVVPFNVNSGTAGTSYQINNTITFTATAN